MHSADCFSGITKPTNKQGHSVHNQFRIKIVGDYQYKKARRAEEKRKQEYADSLVRRMKRNYPLGEYVVAKFMGVDSLAFVGEIMGYNRSQKAVMIGFPCANEPEGRQYFQGNEIFDVHPIHIVSKTTGKDYLEKYKKQRAFHYQPPVNA